jgi:hypothetical protein
LPGTLQPPFPFSSHLFHHQRNQQLEGPSLESGVEIGNGDEADLCHCPHSRLVSLDVTSADEVSTSFN